MKTANEEDAHAWRAQTLRLLHPQLTQDANVGTVEMHSDTDNRIVQAALLQARRFVDWPGSVLIKPACSPDPYNKIGDIFVQAARLAYELWTRKTALRCITLVNMDPNVRFSTTDPGMVHHALVKYNESEEELNGRPLRLVVHPLLQVWGTDDGDNYDKNRVWMPAEVWLPNQHVAEKEENLMDMMDI